MIDFTVEEPIPIQAAPSHIPGRPALSTTWRWILVGIRGRILESGMIGGRRYTSREAIRRFLSADDSTDPHVSVSPSHRRKQAVAADKALQDRGLGKASGLRMRKRE